jgi:AmiR/NasT family two-component response regulator
MLSQLHDMRLPRRSGEEKALIDEAKRLLMRREGIDEPAAHRHMQQYAMRHNMKMTEYASQLLQGGSNDV